MIATLAFVGLAIVLLLALIWLVRTPAPAPAPPISGPEAKLQIEDLFSLNCRHFPQVRQALSSADLAYLKQHASPQTLRQVRTERRRVARMFLAGLREDFSRLDRLARTIAALSVQVSRAREAERFWLGMRFRILYALVLVRLASGRFSLRQLEVLTGLIGSLAAQMETAMEQLEEASVGRLRSNLTA
jgi:hypothetical protein